MRALWLGVVVGIFTGCGGSAGSTEIAYPLFARADKGGETTGQGWQVAVDEASVGFGPLYLCASISATPDLCQTAVAEWTDSATIDGRRPDPVRLGTVTGTSATVNSALFDFATSWTLADPRALSGAPGGHAARFRVTAKKGDRTLRITADIDIPPQQRSSRAVSTRVPMTLQSSSLRLDLTFPVHAWWRKVDLDALSDLGNDDLSFGLRADEPRAITFARSAIVTAMTSAERPTFVWTTP